MVELRTYTERVSVRYTEPGKDVPLSKSFVPRKSTAYAEDGLHSDNDDDGDISSDDYESEYRTNFQRSGPDGQGKDLRIKSAKEFSDCFAEVVARLSELRTFRWCSKVTPVPNAVFEALRHVKLKALHLDLTAQRNNVHTRECLRSVNASSDELKCDPRSAILGAHLDSLGSIVQSRIGRRFGRTRLGELLR